MRLVQAVHTRDALARMLYLRLFSFLVAQARPRPARRPASANKTRPAPSIAEAGPVQVLFAAR